MPINQVSQSEMLGYAKARGNLFAEIKTQGMNLGKICMLTWKRVNWQQVSMKLEIKLSMIIFVYYITGNYQEGTE